MKESMYSSDDDVWIQPIRCTLESAESGFEVEVSPANLELETLCTVQLSVPSDREGYLEALPPQPMTTPLFSRKPF